MCGTGGGGTEKVGDGWLRGWRWDGLGIGLGRREGFDVLYYCTTSWLDWDGMGWVGDGCNIAGSQRGRGDMYHMLFRGPRAPDTHCLLTALKIHTCSLTKPNSQFNSAKSGAAVQIPDSPLSHPGSYHSIHSSCVPPYAILKQGSRRSSMDIIYPL